MKKIFKFLMAFWGAIGFVVVSFIALPAYADIQNPVIVLDSGTVSKNTAVAGESLTVTWRVTDDLDCCDFNRINFVADGNTSNSVLSFFDSPTLISGSQTNGVYSKTFTVPSLAAGVYELKAQVTDKAGKYSGLDRVARVTISAGADETRPSVSWDDSSISPSTVDRGQSATITVNISDQGGCCSSVLVRLVSTTGTSYPNQTMILVSGTSNLGTYQASLPTTPAMVSGNHFVVLAARDNAGNESSQSIGFLNIDPENDSTAPLVQTPSSFINTSNAPSGSTVEFVSGGPFFARIGVTDNSDCCARVAVKFLDTAGGAVWNLEATKVSGDIFSSQYQVSTAINTGIVPSTLRVVAVATDASGNVSTETQIGTAVIKAATTTDAAAPVVVANSGALTPSTTTAGASIRATWQVTDDLACCDFHRIHVIPEGGGTFDAVAYFDGISRVSGSDRNATYTKTFNLPSSIQAGNYDIRVQVTDKSGKFSDNVTVAKLTVTSGADTQAPVVVRDSGTLLSSTVKGGETISATWRVTDNVGCCDFHRIHVIPKGGGTWDAISWHDGITQVSGSPTDGTYRRAFTMPQAAAGDYELWVWVTDKAGNFSSNTRIAGFTVGAVTDSQNPVVVLGSGTVSKPSLRAGEQLTVTWRVTDDLDCCDFNRINIMPQGADNAQIRAFFDGAVRVSGDGKNGTYSKTFIVPTLPAGNYSLRAQATDKVGKFTRLDEVATFSVVTALDAANPVIVPGSGVVFPSTAAPGDKVTLLYQVTDDLDCCNPHDAYMYDATGAWLVRNQAVLVSGTKTNATYRVEFMLPVNLTTGTYTFKSQVTDKAGKFSKLQELGSVRVSAQDTQNPVIVPASATLSSTTPVTGDALTVSYRATDDIGGFAPHDAYVYDANNNLVLRAPASLISGGVLNSIFRATFSLGTTLASGQYTVRSQVTDSAGNYSNLQLLGSFVFTNQSQERAEIVSSTGLASPSLVQPGSIVRVSFTVMNDNNDITTRAQVQDMSLRTLASGASIRLFRGIGLTQYYADVRIPVGTTPGSYYFAATLVDDRTGFRSGANLGTFVVQSDQTQLGGPRNLRVVDGGGLSPSSLVWDSPVTTSSNPVISYTAQSLTNDGVWSNFCQSDVNNRSCFLYNRNLNGKPIVAYRVAAIGSQGAGSYVSMSQPASLTFVGDPIFTPANQPVAIPSSAVLNVGTFNGKIVVYAKGMKGATLSWKIAGKWQKATVTKDFQLFDRPTRAIGLTVSVDLFVNGNQPGAFSKTVVTK